MGSRLGQANTLRGLGDLERGLGNIPAAVAQYRTVFDIAERIGFGEHPVTRQLQAEYIAWLLEEWLATPDWNALASFLREYQAELLSEAAEMLLRRALREYPDDRTLTTHLALLAVARAAGIEAAYTAFGTPDLVTLERWAAVVVDASATGDRALAVGALILAAWLLRAYNVGHMDAPELTGYDAVITLYRQMIAAAATLSPPVPTDELRADVAWALNALGNYHDNREEPDRARAAYTEALAFDETNAMVYCNRASVAISQGDFAAARADLERAAALEPDAPVLPQRWCEFYLWQGDADAACPYAQALLERPGEAPEGAYYLAICAALAGHLDQARQQMAEARRRASPDKRAEGLKDLRMLADAQPTHATALEALAAMLRESPPG